jgi:hypothetical protein
MAAFRSAMAFFAESDRAVYGRYRGVGLEVERRRKKGKLKTSTIFYRHFVYMDQLTSNDKKRQNEEERKNHHL